MKKLKSNNILKFLNRISDGEGKDSKYYYKKYYGIKYGFVICNDNFYSKDLFTPKYHYSDEVEPHLPKFDYIGWSKIDGTFYKVYRTENLNNTRFSNVYRVKKQYKEFEKFYLRELIFSDWFYDIYESLDNFKYDSYISNIFKQIMIEVYENLCLWFERNKDKKYFFHNYNTEKHFVRDIVFDIYRTYNLMHNKRNLIFYDMLG